MLFRDFLVVQWLRLCVSYAGGVGSIPDQGAIIRYHMQCWCSQKKIKNKINCILKKKKDAYKLSCSSDTHLHYKDRSSKNT